MNKIGLTGQKILSPRRLGLTLVEMLMALAIMGLIGAAIASMLTAVSYGTSDTRDLRSLVPLPKLVRRAPRRWTTRDRGTERTCRKCGSVAWSPSTFPSRDRSSGRSGRTRGAAIGRELPWTADEPRARTHDFRVSAPAPALERTLAPADTCLPLGIR